MDVKIKVWIVGKWGTPWAFQGVFTTKQKAIAACVDWNYFIGPALLDEVLPSENMPWPGAYYPNPPGSGEADPPR